MLTQSFAARCIFYVEIYRGEDRVLSSAHLLTLSATLVYANRPTTAHPRRFDICKISLVAADAIMGWQLHARCITSVTPTCILFVILLVVFPFPTTLPTHTMNAHADSRNHGGMPINVRRHGEQDPKRQKQRSRPSPSVVGCARSTTLCHPKVKFLLRVTFKINATLSVRAHEKSAPASC